MPTPSRTRHAEQTHGLDTAHNYDLIVKAMGELFQGQTLELFGVASERITETFGFEPVDLRVSGERVDLMLRDEAGAVFHLEEQRNLQRADLYRFASYHFAAARKSQISTWT